MTKRKKEIIIIGSVVHKERLGDILPGGRYLHRRKGIQDSYVKSVF